MKDTFIQVGITALRTPTGDFLPSIPLYIRTSEATQANGLTNAEEVALQGLGEVVARKHIASGGKASTRHKQQAT